jgi:effector-binding domain-containing protein
LWKDVIIPALVGIKNGFSWVATKLVSSLQYLSDKTVRVFRHIFTKIIPPVFKAIRSFVNYSSNLLSEYVIKPASILISKSASGISSAVSFMAQKVSNLFNAIFDSIIYPVSINIKNLALTTKDFAVTSMKNSQHNISMAWKRIVNFFAKNSLA